MDSVALKDFEFSRDGVNLETVKDGERLDFPDLLFPGAKASGKVKEFRLEDNPGALPLGYVLLLGSSTFPNQVEVGDYLVPLGDLVCFAHIASQLSKEAWNELADDVRDIKLANALDAMRFLNDPSLAVQAALDHEELEKTEEPQADPEKTVEPPAVDADAELEALKLEYTELYAKKPHHMWVAATLKKKIAEHKKGA